MNMEKFLIKYKVSPLEFQRALDNHINFMGYCSMYLKSYTGAQYSIIYDNNKDEIVIVDIELTEEEYKERQEELEVIEYMELEDVENEPFVYENWRF